MTLFQIADVLWRHGENEAYNALVKHTREYTTIVECGLTLLAKDIAERAAHHEILTDLEADLQLDDDRWAEAHKRASAFTSVTADDYPIISYGIYKQLCEKPCEEDWRAA